jgi:hypothetical protein
VLYGIGANRCERLGDLWTGCGKAGVDKELTVTTGEDRDISAGAHEDADVAAEDIDSDGSGGGCLPRCFD